MHKLGRKLYLYTVRDAAFGSLGWSDAVQDKKRSVSLCESADCCFFQCHLCNEQSYTAVLAGRYLTACHEEIHVFL